MTVSSWAASGAMALTGRAGGPPLVAPEGLVAAMQELGAGPGVDVLPLLAERAGCTGFRRRGARSCGGGTRLLPTADGDLVAVSLVRPDDVALLPAWIGVDEPPNGAMDEPTWVSVGEVAAATTSSAMVEGGAQLGLPVSRRGETPHAPAVIPAHVGTAAPLVRPPLVVDLSSLWAGPLATRLLRDAGARVVKVESTARPDGARYGDARFFDLLHAGKESVALDLQAPAGAVRLQALVRAADVVVEASRPRALAHLGLDAEAVLADGPRVWLSITGHGRTDPHRERVAFGDDAAVAGGLVAEVEGDACFVADAVADPLTGVVAAAAVLDALGSGRRVLLDVALARVAAHVARAAGDAQWRAGTDDAARPPTAPEPRGRAPELGEHTEAVLHEILG